MSVISALSVKLLQSYPAPFILHSSSVPGQFVHIASKNIEDIRVRQVKKFENMIQQQFSVNEDNRTELMTNYKVMI